MRLFAGDDRAGGHHDTEVMDEAGKVLARRRLPEGAAGMSRLHALAGSFPGEDAGEPEVEAGTGTGQGPRVMALIAADTGSAW